MVSINYKVLKNLECLINEQKRHHLPIVIWITGKAVTRRIAHPEGGYIEKIPIHDL